jgi:hypothetical protein
MPCLASCQTAMNERDAVGLALASGGVALLPGAQVMWGLVLGQCRGQLLGRWRNDPANVAIWLVNYSVWGTELLVPWAECGRWCAG